MYYFADVVHVSNHWILAQAMAHAPVPNFVPQLLCCDHFDQWCEPRLAWTSWYSNRVNVTCTTAVNISCYNVSSNRKHWITQSLRAYFYREYVPLFYCFSISVKTESLFLAILSYLLPTNKAIEPQCWVSHHIFSAQNEAIHNSLLARRTKIQSVTSQLLNSLNLLNSMSHAWISF